MKAEIITIGDELLIGQVVDTNSAWIGQQLNLAGIEVQRINSVSDQQKAIVEALDESLSRATIVLITGGLGPTKDDITKLTLSQYFNAPLVHNEQVYKEVEAFFKKWGREVSPLNRKQAEIPSNCQPISNKRGTAPGMWFQLPTANTDLANGNTAQPKIVVSMPGVPHEMKAMVENEVLPRLKQLYKLPIIVHKTILLQGIGESYLSEKISEWEDNLKAANIKLAYLPATGKVRLRLTSKGENREQLISQIDEQIEKVLPLINNYIYGYEVYGQKEPSIEEIVGQALKNNQATISTAESCTAGYISHLLTRLPGSSAYFKGAVIAYANETKENSLGVQPQTIATYGTVSQQVVEEMAANVKQLLKTDYAISASGVAGPDGGTPETPVGTVWIGIATPSRVVAQKFQFGGNREQNIQLTADTALNLLRKEIAQ